MDKYSCFRELEQAEQGDVDYVIVERPGATGVAIIAPHGGGIEPGTSEIADAIAEREHGLYCFVGRKSTGNRDLHITSTKFDEPRAMASVKSAQRVVTVHGCEGEEEIAYIGGLDEELKQRICDRLKEAGFAVSEPADCNLGGVSKENVCNRNARGMGVQLELTSGLRSRLFVNLTRRGRQERTELFDKMVAAIRAALSEG